MKKLGTFLTKVALGAQKFLNSRAGRISVFLLVFALMASAARADSFVVYDEATGDVDFNPGWLLAKIINMVVACITAGIPLVLIGMGVAKALRVFGWLGAPNKR